MGFLHLGTLLTYPLFLKGCFCLAGVLDDISCLEGKMGLKGLGEPRKTSGSQRGSRAIENPGRIFAIWLVFGGFPVRACLLKGM